MSDAARRHDRFFRGYFESPEVLGELLELALPYECRRAGARRFPTAYRGGPVGPPLPACGTRSARG